MKKITNRVLLGAMLVVGLILISGCSQNQNNPANPDAPSSVVTMFKSPTCGCCGVYAQYMKREGFSVDVKDVNNMDKIKKDYNIPANLQSCHTTKVGDYFVEGHVPVEAIEKLMSEKPDIAGIALPGMPQGSPGMPGNKNQQWIIYSINRDGSYGEFMRI